MSFSNQEQTEARLAAYLDGRLDTAEREQIEQYLQSNPEHRKLLAKLAEHRDVLQSLPRSKAPPDVYDAIQSQLERSLLLDDGGSSLNLPIRHSRKPQLLGIAAIVLLAVGLGVALWVALPTTPVAQRPQYADNRAASEPTTIDTAPSTNTTLLADLPRERALIAPASLPLLNEPAIQSATLTGPDDNLVVVVSSNQPTQAQEQITTYLRANNIQFSSSSEDTEKDRVVASAKFKSERRPLEDNLQKAAVPATSQASEPIASSIMAIGLTRQQAEEACERLSLAPIKQSVSGEITRPVGAATLPLATPFGGSFGAISDKIESQSTATSEPTPSTTQPLLNVTFVVQPPHPATTQSAPATTESVR